MKSFFVFDSSSKATVNSLFSLSFPIIVANLLQTAYNMIDTFWVGRLGSDAVAAVSVSFPVIFFLVSLGFGVGIASSILVATNFGGKRLSKVNYLVAQSLFFSFVISLFISVIGFFLSPILISLFGVSDSVFPLAVSYLRYSFLGLVFVFLFFVIQSLLRGVSEVKKPALIVLLTVILNFFLDPLFIFGFGPVPALGVSGAALATLFTQALASFLGVALLLRGVNGVKISFRSFKPDFSVMKKFFSLGLPATLESSSRSLGLVLMNFIVASFGSVALASFGVGSRIFSFVIIPAVGFSMASSTLVSQSLGAGNKSRVFEVVRWSLLISFSVLFVAGLLFFLFAERIAFFFVPSSLAVVSETTFFIRVLSLSFPFLSSMMVLSGSFRGAGNTFLAMLLSLFGVFVLRVPFAFIFSRFSSLGLNAVWFSYPFSILISFFLSLFLYFKVSWIKNV